MFYILAQVSQSVSQTDPSEEFGVSLGVLAGALLVTLLIAHISGKLGEAAGMSYWLFALLGFFFGLIGLVISLIVYAISGSHRRSKARMGPDPYGSYMPPGPDYYGSSIEPPAFPPSPVPPPDNAYREGFKMCPNCSANVPSNEQACWNCGAFFQSNPAGTICTTCHQKLPAGSTFCNNCGSRVDGFSSSWQ